MRLSTTSTRRAIDKWKGRARSQASKSKYWALEMAAIVLVSARWGRFAVLPFLGVAAFFNFAAIQLVVLAFVGFFVAKLHFYRLVNSIVGFFTLSR